MPGKPDIPPIELHPLLAAVLSRLNAGWTVDDLSALLHQKLGQSMDKLNEIVRDARACYRRHLERAETGAWAAPEGRIDEMLDELAGSGETFEVRNVVLPGDRMPFPKQLQWLVTRYCDRRCIYCYQSIMPGESSADSEIPVPRVMEILDECWRLGVQSMYITGGEPLLRPDLCEVVRRAVELEIRPDIYTKHFVTEEEADRLAATGLKSIWLSIDSMDPEVAERVTGTERFAESMASVIERLIRRGFMVRTSTVLTSENARTIPFTMQRLEKLGVTQAAIDAWGRTGRPSLDYLTPSVEVSDQVCEWVARFNEAEGRSITVTLANTVRDRVLPMNLKQDRILCHNGVTALLFNPVGQVIRCDKELPGMDVVVGDLRTQAVHEVWSSERMISTLKPPRELYKGSLCYDCDFFEWCHRQGRCFYESYVTGKTLYGPYGNCPFHQKEERRRAEAGETQAAAGPAA